jgi:hypothetical protein
MIGPAYRNRTHIHGVEDRCIIHYTKAGYFGGNGKSRTFTEHRMKVEHYRYATLPKNMFADVLSVGHMSRT